MEIFAAHTCTIHEDNQWLPDILRLGWAVDGATDLTSSKYLRTTILLPPDIPGKELQPPVRIV